MINNVIDKGFCVGCGACKVANKDVDIIMSTAGKFEAVVPKSSPLEQIEMARVCPFSNSTDNETTLNPLLNLSQDGVVESSAVGKHYGVYAAHVVDEEDRLNSASGGVVTWLTKKLLRDGEIDAVVHATSSDDFAFEYTVSKSVTEINSGRKSKYYPVTMHETLKYIEENDLRYLVVGVPCFIKSINLLKKYNPKFESRIKYTASLYCGHLKTSKYADFLSSAIKGEALLNDTIDFRVKDVSSTSSNYITEIFQKDGRILSRKTNSIFGTNWGFGLFKYKSCDYCDDVSGETADISFGDAWLKRFEQDALGHNIVVTRNAKLDALLNNSSEELSIEYLSLEEAYDCQAGGYRHRNQGLSYRLWVAKLFGRWVPKKRIVPSNSHKFSFKMIVVIRILLRKYSLLYGKLPRTVFNLGMKLLAKVLGIFNRLNRLGGS